MTAPDGHRVRRAGMPSELSWHVATPSRCLSIRGRRPGGHTTGWSGGPADLLTEHLSNNIGPCPGPIQGARVKQAPEPGFSYGGSYAPGTNSARGSRPLTAREPSAGSGLGVRQEADQA